MSNYATRETRMAELDHRLINGEIANEECDELDRLRDDDAQDLKRAMLELARREFSLRRMARRFFKRAMAKEEGE